MAARRRLENRRASETFTLECAALLYTCTVSRFPDGSIAELFLSNHKAGSSPALSARR